MRVGPGTSLMATQAGRVKLAGIVQPPLWYAALVTALPLAGLENTDTVLPREMIGLGWVRVSAGGTYVPVAPPGPPPPLVPAAPVVPAPPLVPAVPVP